jgi:transposase-like protein
VKAITEELCGHSFAASTISAINKGLDEGLTKFAQRQLTEDYPHLIVDARQHHKHLKSTNMLERLNEELRPRTRVVRIFRMWRAAFG